MINKENIDNFLNLSDSEIRKRINAAALEGNISTERLKKALSNIGLDTDAAKYITDKNSILTALIHDKKSEAGGAVNAVILKDIGDFEFVKLTPEELIERLD